MGENLPRRTFLTGGSAVGTVVIAGCTDVFDGDGTDETDEDVQLPDDSGSDDSSTPADDEGTSDPENEPPEIVEFDVEPSEYGTNLVVYLEGEDDAGIERAEVSYGDLGLTESPNDTSVTVESEVTDIHEAELEETPGTVVVTLEDSEGELTEEELRPHSGYPSVSVRTAATATPGEIAVEIEAEDDIGLHWVELGLNGESIEEVEAVGTAEIDLEFLLSDDEISPGETNDVTATVRNTFGSTRANSQEQYVREYEPLDDDSIDIGTVYIPFMGGPDRSKWGSCTVGTAEVGEYSHERGEFEETGREATNRHIDLMNGYGINRVMFNFGEEVEDYERYKNFVDTELSDEIEMECFYVIHQVLNRERDVDQDLEFISDEIFEHPNYSKIDNRPLVTFWWMKTAILNDSHRSNLESEYGSFEGFVDHIRSELTHNGTEPFLVADTDDMAEDGYWDGHYDVIEQFDAVTNWINVDPNSTEDWDDRMQYMENIYSHNAELADEIDVEFIPSVFPGFDDRDNHCWGENRLIPPDPARLRDLLEMADEYKTIDRININTWNDWNEGHQIEPGTYQGESYGTERLDVVKKFAQGDG